MEVTRRVRSRVADHTKPFFTHTDSLKRRKLFAFESPLVPPLGAILDDRYPVDQLWLHPWILASLDLCQLLIVDFFRFVIQVDDMLPIVVSK